MMAAVAFSAWMVASDQVVLSRSAASFVSLRTADPVVLAALEQGREQSQTFANLVDRIESARTIVHIVRVIALPHGMEGCLVPGSTHDVREGMAESPVHYLKVLVRMDLSPRRLIVVLAHEFQHVREVIDSGGSANDAAVDLLYRHVGEPQLGSAGREQYETAAASRVMTTVLRELREWRSPKSR